MDIGGTLMDIKDCLPNGAGTCRNTDLIEELRADLSEATGSLRKELDARTAEWRQFVKMSHDDQITELERRWQEAEARAAELEVQLSPLQQQFDDWAEQNRRAETRAATAEAEYQRANERMLAIANGYEIILERMHEKENWAATWKRKAKHLREDVRKCHGMAGEINLLTDAERELTQENARLREALLAARQFIRNGIEFGYITMPDPETPDPAHDTLPMIEKVLGEQS